MVDVFCFGFVFVFLDELGCGWSGGGVFFCEYCCGDGGGYCV